MSKLDRFLVSETLFNSCPNISALSLERYLSDHRPILLRESYFDYGPTSFRFFHYWSDLEGFGNMVEAAWKEYLNVEQNAMTNMMGKLKHLKKKIREWNIKDKQRRSMDKDKYKVDLEALDTIIDQGNGNEEIVKQRSKIVSKLLHIDKLNSVEMAQKAKVKWSIEGDENTSFFHGREFFNHFRNMFDKPDGIRAITHMELAGVLGDIVNEVQSAFVTDRQILDGPFILNKVIQWCKSKKKQSLVFKVDFEKAYDSVRWDFLDDILGKFGFGNKCACGSKSVSSLREWVEEAEMFKGIKIGPTVTLSHMFYADDAVFVGKWCESNITTLVHVLDCFHRASGLKINMSKSKISGVHVVSDRVKEAALRLGCLTLKTSFLYLRSKVGGSMSRLHEWDEAMYGDKGKIDAEVKTGSRSCWLNIVHEVKILTQKGITLRDFMRIKLGNGENTSFWEDCWIEGDSLRNRFPRLYTLESCKRITVGEKMRQSSLEFSFRRNTRGGVEQEQLGDLVTWMHDVSLSPMADRWTWELENSGEFTVSSLIPGVGSKTRWIKYVPIKVNVNAWKVKLDALPTRMITRWWDVSYEDFVDYDDWRTWIINLRLPSKNKMMLEVKALFFDDVRTKSYNWCRYRCNDSFSRNDWLKNRNLISL
nr:RNA-directed DNA polymerase, eukaryota [Tanacetum cinerariifolium]